MSRTCGNCGTEMEQDGNLFYCPNCDETFEISKGKQFPNKKPNTILKLKDGQSNLNDRLSKVEETLEIRNTEAFPGF